MSKNPISFLYSFLGKSREPSGEILNSVKAKANSRRTRTERMADWMTLSFGNMTFLVINTVVFVFWMLINTDHMRDIPPFDPFPFSLLNTIISLEAIILAIFVLMSQNRDIKIDDLREEMHLQVNLISEREITKIMKMIAMLLEKHGVDLSADPELKALIKPINEEEITKKLQKEIF